MASRSVLESAPVTEIRATRPWVWAVMLLVITAAAYGPAIPAGYVWDDETYVLNNPLLRTAKGLGDIWFTTQTPQYYPMVFTSFWIEYRLWGDHATGFHITNILLHGVAALLFWRILLRLNVPGSFLGAAIFAVHPVCVESVAWITERKNVLCAVFSFATVLVWLQAEETRSERRRFLSFGTFGLAMLSKTVACTLAVTLPLLVWYRNGRLTRGDLGRLLPLWIIGVLFGLYTALLERVKVGAEGAEWDLSIPERILVAGRAVFFYAGKLMWPGELIFIYPRYTPDAGQWTQWLFPIGVVAVTGTLWLARRAIGRGAFSAVACYVVTLGPALGFVNVYPFRFSFFADHFQYLACPGIIALVVGCFVALTRRLGRRRSRLVCTASGLVTCLILGTLTFRHARAFADAETLYRDTLAKNPSAWLASYNLGAQLYMRGDYSEALELFHATLRSRPNHAGAWTYLGAEAEREGDLARALEHYRTAVRAEPENRVANARLANAYGAAGDHVAAVRCYRRMLAGVSDEVLAGVDYATRAAALFESRAERRQLAWLLATSPDASVRNAEEALRLATQSVFAGTPDEAIALRVLAAALAESGRFDDAAEMARRAGALARTRGNEALATRIDRDLASYQAGRPVRWPGRRVSDDDH